MLNFIIIASAAIGVVLLTNFAVDVIRERRRGE